MKLSRILIVVALAAMPLAAGCNGDSTGSSSITGTYTLKTVQGKSLPAPIFAEFGGGIEALTGPITLRYDRTYSLEILFRVTQGTAVTTDTYDEQGTYVRNGNASHAHGVRHLQRRHRLD